MIKEKVPELEKLEKAAAYLRGYLEGYTAKNAEVSVETISAKLSELEKRIETIRARLADPTLDDVSRSALVVAARAAYNRALCELVQ